MKVLRVFGGDSDAPILNRVPVALGMWARFRGLMLRRRLEDGEGLLIPHCRSVHTCFMRFPIDVIYLDEGNGIVKIVEAMKAWRVSCCMRADAVLETRPGWAQESGLKVGSRLRFEPADGEE